VSAAFSCVVETLPARPDLLALHAAHPRRYPHLLQSVAQGTPRARYDLLFAFPGETLTLEANGCLQRGDRRLASSDFFAALDAWWDAERIAPCADESVGAVPFSGGWFLFLAYELLAAVEPTVHGLRHDPTLPIALAMRAPAALIHDHVTGRTQIVCERERAREVLPQIHADLGGLETPAPTVVELNALHEDEATAYLAAVERVLDYIRAGDVFQVNLARAWRAELRDRIAPHVLYRALCAANPAPFAGLMTLAAERAVLSSSPERLIAVRGGVVSTRPIAGTYPRSRDVDQDLAWSRELLAHPKERAEHVMLIDLERNDLGRVCASGTVRVSELMALESYRHVHHIVSEVRGRLRPEVTPGRVIRAVFPGGTITGCPKVRCMQIIAELEQAARGAYTGSMGYLNRDGSLDLNILIRTMVQDGRGVRLQAGAGIVADSVPQRELAETRAKARGMLAALGVAA
jgi:anthranilate synthase component 1